MRGCGVAAESLPCPPSLRRDRVCPVLLLSPWEVGIGSGWDVSARKEKPDYFRSRFLAWGGFVGYPANPRLIVSQYDGKQMVVFRSRGET